MKNRRAAHTTQLSDWVTLTFHAVPGVHVSGLTRIQVLEMDEHFSLYMSPINLNPERPAMPISHPAWYAAELAEATGRFYTQGMPEDTKAFKEGVFTAAEFEKQARLAGDEVVRQYAYVLGRFQGGLLFGDTNIGTGCLDDLF